MDIYQVILQTLRTEEANNYTTLKAQVFQASHVNQTLHASFVHARMRAHTFMYVIHSKEACKISFHARTHVYPAVFHASEVLKLIRGAQFLSCCRIPARRIPMK